VIIEVQLTDEDVDRIARRVAERIGASAMRVEQWLDVAGAATHLALTEDGVRGLVKRRQIPFHRTENSRLRFAVTELDHWVRTGSCAAANEDLP
jgi:hypothetical protein